MPNLLILNAQDVRAHLSMEACMEAVAEAAKAASAGLVEAPLRRFTALTQGRGALATMPAAATEPAVFGLKALSLLPDNPGHGRPMIQGFVALFSQQTGAPIALVDGASLTAIRTAAASGLATKRLARKDVRTHAILGTGVQAETHAEAVLAACPSMEKTLIWGRSFEKAQGVADHVKGKLGADVIATSEIRAAAACDVISAVTASADPLILHQDVRPGAHINLVGSHTPDKREACSRTIAAARLYVDSRFAALQEAGDILIPLKENLIKEDHIFAELGQVLTGQADGRTQADQITVYKSLGNAAQDLFAAWAAVERARAAGAGQTVTL